MTFHIWQPCILLNSGYGSTTNYNSGYGSMTNYNSGYQIALTLGEGLASLCALNQLVVLSSCSSPTLQVLCQYAGFINGLGPVLKSITCHLMWLWSPPQYLMITFGCLEVFPFEWLVLPPCVTGVDPDTWWLHLDSWRYFQLNGFFSEICTVVLYTLAPFLTSITALNSLVLFIPKV